MCQLLLGSTKMSSDPIVILDVIQTEEVCDLANGSVEIIVENPQPGALYSVDNGITFQESNLFNNLISGDYLIIVINGGNCSETLSIQIADAPQPEISIDFACIEGLNKVDINLTPFASGIFPFTYNWEGPNNTTFTNEDLKEVDPGNYYITVADRLGCEITDSVFVATCCEMQMSCPNDTIYIPCMAMMDDTPFEVLPTMPGAVISELRQHNIEITDNCGSINVDVMDIMNLPSTCDIEELEIQRIFEISDGVTQATCKRSFFVDNYLGLSITDQAQNTTVTCDEDVDAAFTNWLAQNGYVEFDACSDNYQIRTFPEFPELTLDCNSEANILVEFIIEDECANTVFSSAEFSVINNAQTELECPQPYEIEFDDPNLESNIQNWTALFTASDDCRNLTLRDNFDMSMISDDCGSQDIVVTFFAENECQEVSECLAPLRILKEFNPVITCPTNLVLTCISPDHDVLVNNWMTETTAFNGGESLTYDIQTDFISVTDLNCGDVVDFEFTINDPCAQDLSCSTSLSIIDEEKPELTCPQNIELFISDIEINSKVEDWLNESSALDNCFASDVTHDFNMSLLTDICSIEDQYEVTFTTSDNCNNTNNCQSRIKFISSNLSISCPEVITLECGDINNEDLLSDWMLLSYAEYENGTPVSIENSAIVVPECGLSEMVEFSAIGLCGDQSSCNSEIKVIDSQVPNITCPQSIYANTNDDDFNLTVQEWISSASSSDLCTSTELQNNLNGDFSWIECEETLMVEFTAQDMCGNTNECLSEITVSREGEIEIICPETEPIGCFENNIEQVIEQWVQNSEVESLYDYTISSDFNISDINTNCEESEMLNILVTAIDVCDLEADCDLTIDLLPEPKLYIPNVFQPFNNNVNSYFTVYGNTSVDYIISLRVYNRWGSKIFENENFSINDPQQGWDGTYRSQEEGQFAFTYIGSVMDIFGNKIPFEGSIQIVK